LLRLGVTVLPDGTPDLSSNITKAFRSFEEYGMQKTNKRKTPENWGAQRGEWGSRGDRGQLGLNPRAIFDSERPPPVAKPTNKKDRKRGLRRNGIEGGQKGGKEERWGAENPTLCAARTPKKVAPFELGL